MPPSSKLAIDVLQRCGRDPYTRVPETGVLPPHPEHIAPNLESAAVAMYRSTWWVTVPDRMHVRGEATSRREHAFADAISGEFPWR